MCIVIKVCGCICASIVKRAHHHSASGCLDILMEGVIIEYVQFQALKIRDRVTHIIVGYLRISI